MKTLTLILLLSLNFSLQAIPDEGEVAISPLDVSETFPYRWCVKEEKKDKEKMVFRTVLEIKNYMRRNLLRYVYVKDCFVDEDYVTSKYRKFNRLLRSDYIGGENYENLFITR